MVRDPVDAITQQLLALRLLAVILRQRVRYYATTRKEAKHLQMVFRLLGGVRKSQKLALGFLMIRSSRGRGGRRRQVVDHRRWVHGGFPRPGRSSQANMLLQARVWVGQTSGVVIEKRKRRFPRNSLRAGFALGG